MVSQLGVIVVSFADTLMVARCGTAELGASAFVNSIFMVAMVMLIGFASGLTPLVGSAFGSKDHELLNHTVRAGIRVNVGVATVFTLILGVVYFFTDVMGQPSELMHLARPYYLVILSSVIPIAIFNALQQVSNGCTDTVTPMCIVLTGNILNIFGNWLLIEGNWGCPAMGLTGAGIATLSARVFMAVGMIIIFALKDKSHIFIKSGSESIAPTTSDRTVWHTSWPVMIQCGIEASLWSFGGIVSGWFGTVQLASYQVVNTISQLGFMLYLGLAVAVSIRVANLCGRGESESIRRATASGLRLVLGLALLSSMVFIFSFDQMVQFFTPDISVYKAAIPLLLPLILYQFADATQLTYANALRGTSYVRPLLWASLISYIGVGIPAMLVLAVSCEMKNVGVYYSFSFALVTAAILLRHWFIRTINQKYQG